MHLIYEKIKIRNAIVYLKTCCPPLKNGRYRADVCRAARTDALFDQQSGRSELLVPPSLMAHAVHRAGLSIPRNK